jgi:5-methylcytosine-specific restriction endonuclease McrA
MRSRSRERRDQQEEKKDQITNADDRSRSESPTRRKKAPIPRALREQVWLKYVGKNYESKCTVGWCENKITVFDFQSGHIIPESKGGPTTLENLMPICSRCNSSMNNQYTITEWNTLGTSQLSFYKRWSSKCRLIWRLMIC